MSVARRIAGLERRMRVTGCPECGGKGAEVVFVITRDDGERRGCPPPEPPRYGCPTCGRIRGLRFEIEPRPQA